MGKKRSEEEYLETYGDHSDEWYDRHISSIPEGCQACGGDYPNCKDSCPMFDD